MSEVDDLRLYCAAKVAALADALRSIPADLRPRSRSITTAIREQVYYGWELPLARARGMTFLETKYEIEGVVVCARR